MTDSNSRATERQQARDEARAKRKQQIATALAEVGVSAAEGTLFTLVYYGISVPPAELAATAAWESYRLSDEVTEDVGRLALQACLDRRWLQIMDEATLSRIAADLRRENVLGPVYGFMRVGAIDFTPSGAMLWQELQRRWHVGSSRPPTAYADVVYEKTAWYFPSMTAAVAGLETLRCEEDLVSVVGPVPIGPWRAQWWRRFPEGYRIDVEQRRQWQGRASGGDESCFLYNHERQKDPERLKQVLVRHNLSAVEWFVLAGMELGYFRDSTANLSSHAAELGNKIGFAVTPEECRGGLETCLQNGLIRKITEQTVEEIQLLFDSDLTQLAIPRTAMNRPRECCFTVDPQRPGVLVPTPFPPSRYLGELDFSPAGAGLYRAISAEWLGSDWEDALRVSRCDAWEEHHYCESGEGFDRIIREHIAKGDNVRASRVVPLGPWCVRWWQRFASGYRLKLELGDP